MAKTKEEPKLEEVKDSSETREEPKPIEETKPTEEPKKTEEPKLSFSATIQSLEENKQKEIHSYIVSRMLEAGKSSPEDIMSGIAASMFRISGASIEGLTVNVNALCNAYPKVVAVIRSAQNDTKTVVAGVASALEISAKK